MLRFDDQTNLQYISNMFPTNVNSHIKLIHFNIDVVDKNLDHNQKEIEALKNQINGLKLKCQTNLQLLQDITKPLIDNIAQNTEKMIKNQRQENRKFNNQLNQLRKQKITLKNNINIELQKSNYLIEQIGQY